MTVELSLLAPGYWPAVHPYRPERLVAFVDDDDYERCLGIAWYAEPAARTCYAGGSGVGRLHRFILELDGPYLIGERWRGRGPASDLVVNHVNGFGLDCRRENLQILTPVENRRWVINGKRAAL